MIVNGYIVDARHFLGPVLYLLLIMTRIMPWIVVDPLLKHPLRCRHKYYQLFPGIDSFCNLWHSIANRLRRWAHVLTHRSNKMIQCNESTEPQLPLPECNKIIYLGLMSETERFAHSRSSDSGVQWYHRLSRGRIGRRTRKSRRKNWPRSPLGRNLDFVIKNARYGVSDTREYVKIAFKALQNL